MNLQDLLQKLKGNPFETILGTLVVFLVVFAYLRGNTYEQADEELATLRRQGTQANENIRRAADIEEHLQDLSEITEAIEERLFHLPVENIVPRQDALERNREALRRLAGTAGVELTDIQHVSPPAPDPAPDSKPARAARDSTNEKAPETEYVFHSFRLAVQGEFESLVAFIHSIESGRYYVRTDSFHLQRSPVEEEREVIATLLIAFLGSSS